MIILSSVLPVASSALRAVRQIAVAVAAPVVGLARTLQNRREITALAQLDDHALKDIGLTRTDVHGALAVSVLEDPSHVLKDIAGAGHRQSIQAAVHGSRRTTVIDHCPREA